MAWLSITTWQHFIQLMQGPLHHDKKVARILPYVKFKSTWKELKHDLTIGYGNLRSDDRTESNQQMCKRQTQPKREEKEDQKQDQGVV